jgi:arylsulfatase A-like enzyme
VTTVAELLRDNGYTTIGVVSNFVLRKGGGFDQGFDFYDDRMDEVELVRGIPERIAEGTTERAVNLLRLHKDKRFFLWIHYQDPHGPYTPQGQFRTMFVDEGLPARDLQLNETVSGKGGIPSYQQLGENRDFNYYVAQYDGEIRYFDEHFGRLIEALKQLGLYDNSLIIFTSDHGEGMGGHDYYFAHGEYVYNSLIQVPLIMRFGGRSEVRNDMVQLIDVVPTILEIAGLEPRPQLRGTNILAAPAGNRPAFSEMPGRYSLVRNRLKLIHHAEDKEILLFDIVDDPGETLNLAGDPRFKEGLADLAEGLSVLRSQNLLGHGVRRRTPQITEEEKEKLKALGYVQ